MHKFYTCLLLLLTGIGLSTYAQISVNIISPAAPYLVDTTVNLEVAVTSTYTISSVRATVSGRQTTLTYTPPRYYGRINVADLPFDTLLLTITVTDVLGNIKDTGINIIHDAKPALVTDSLLNYAVATPTLHIKASATDNTAIDSMTLSGDGFSYLFNGNTIDTTINMSSLPNGSETFLRITATDNRHQKTTRTFTIIIEASPYLERVYTTPYRGRIIDYKNNKVLIDDEDSLHHRIVDIQTKVMSEIPLHNRLERYQAFLTPYGAFFATRAADDPYYNRTDSIYDWNSGVFKLRTRSTIPGLLVAGRYAIWERWTGINTDTTYFRDFSTGADHALLASQLTYEYVLAKNGRAFYRTVDYINEYIYSIYSYYEGQTTLLPFPSALEYLPRYTDGKELLFATFPNLLNNLETQDSLFTTTNNATSRVFISKLSRNSDVVHPKLNNGYVAYGRFDDSLLINSHLYLWDSAGHDQQKTFWANNIAVKEKIKVLDSTGSFILAEASEDPSVTIAGYYYAGIDGSLVKLTDYVTYRSGDANDVYLENGQYYIAIGNTLFKVNLERQVVPVPVITGLSTQYCGNAGEVIAKVVNPPASGVVATIDSKVVPVLADSTVRFNPDTLSGGPHQLKVSYSDSISTTISFSVLPVTIPDLTLTANITAINTAADTVIITAGVPVGYKNSLYTFAWDRNFMNVIQWESVDATVTIAPDVFAVGNNTVYGKVHTGNTCSSSITATDSIVITRSIVTAVPDIDVPGKMIIAYPNPFTGPVTIKGFQVNKQYTLSLFDMQGKLIQKKRVYQQNKAEMNVVGKGNYILQINDDTKKRVLGSLQIIRL